MELDAAIRATEGGSGVRVGIEARTGARWWADKIREGFFPDAGGQPEDAINDPMAVALVATLQARDAQHITAEKIDAYEQALGERIQAMLDADEAPYIAYIVGFVTGGKRIMVHVALKGTGEPRHFPLADLGRWPT